MIFDSKKPFDLEKAKVKFQYLIENEKKFELTEEFKVTNIKPVNYAEVQRFEDSEKWFKAKVSLICYDEESGREKKSNIYLLVNANDVDDAYNSTILVMKNTMGEYSIPAISETAIVEVFLYQSQE